MLYIFRYTFYLSIYKKKRNLINMKMSKQNSNDRFLIQTIQLAQNEIMLSLETCLKKKKNKFHFRLLGLTFSNLSILGSIRAITLSRSRKLLSHRMELENPWKRFHGCKVSGDKTPRGKISFGRERGGEWKMATVQFQEKTIVVNKLFSPRSHRRLPSSFLPRTWTILTITILFFINIRIVDKIEIFQSIFFRLKIKFQVLIKRMYNFGLEWNVSSLRSK